MNQLEKALEQYTRYRMDQVPEIIESSERFHKNVERMIQKAQFGKRKRHRLRHVLIAALAAILMIVTTVAAVPQLRNGFLRFVQEVFPKYTEIQAVMGTDMTVETKVKTYTINQLPASLQLADQIEMVDCSIAVFQDEEGQGISIEQYPITSYIASIDTENAKTETVVLDGEEAICTVKDENIILVWNLGNYVFQMSGNILKQDMILIARSIKID